MKVIWQVTNPSDPSIHTLNKGATAHKVAKGEIFPNLWADRGNRKHVILLGDSLGDAEMADGVEEPSCVLKIGFLHFDVEQNLQRYKDTFDVVLLGDQSADYILELLRSVQHS